MNRNTRDRIWIGAICLLCLIAITSAGLVVARVKPAKPLSNIPSALPVETMAIKLQDSFVMQRVFSGRVQARRESALGFESAGRLERVLVDEGTTVEQGELIAERDTERLQAKRAELDAARAETEAKLALASATLERMRGIVEQGGVSRQGLDEANEGQRAAAAAARLAGQRIASVDVELDQARLYAPYSGTVVARLADEGVVLDAGQPIVTLQERAVPEIRVGIAGRVLDQLEPGRTYDLEWRNRTIQARLRTLLPMRAATARTVDALFDPRDETASLLPGDIVTLRLGSRIEQTGTWLPITALSEGTRGLWSVFVVDELPEDGNGLAATHRVHRRTVDVIHQASARVYVRGSLTPHEHIVVTGVQRIVPGQQVRTGVSIAATGGDSHD